jgi:hypothetical protein
MARSPYGAFWFFVFLAIVNSTIANANAGANVSTRTVIPLLGIVTFVPAWLTAAGIDVFSFISPRPAPYSYMGPGVAGFMIIGVIYLLYLYRRHPRRVVEVGLVHLDPLEECEREK